MPDRFLTAYLYVLAALSGALGGCGVAGYRVLSGRERFVVWGAAYSTIGAVIGVASLAAHVLVSLILGADVVPYPTGDSAFALGLSTAVFGGALLIIVNWTVTLSMRVKGMTLQLTICRADEETGNG